MDIINLHALKIVQSYGHSYKCDNCNFEFFPFDFTGPDGSFELEKAHKDYSIRMGRMEPAQHEEREHMENTMEVKGTDDIKTAVVFAEKCPKCNDPILRTETRKRIEDQWYHAKCVMEKPAMTEDGLKTIANILSEHMTASVKAEFNREVIEKIVEEQIAKSYKPLSIEVKRMDGTVKKIESAHESFKTLLYLVQKRHHVYLYGEPGSGKSTAAKQVSEALGLEFGYISLNPQTPESRILGFIDAGGTYRESRFYHVYKNGGVFCIDEQDNAFPALLTTLNSLLENGHGAFPCGIIPRHENFILVSTGNTNGRGANPAFPDRRAFDAAFTERFTFLYWGYDESLEKTVGLSINPDALEWVNFVQKARSYAKQHHPRVLITPRATYKGAAYLKDDDLSVAEIAEAVIWKGTSREIVNDILGEIPLPRKRG